MSDKKFILILEDSETIVEFYKGMLVSFYSKIDVANTTEEALNRMHYSDYDLYIIDIKLEGSGLEGIEIIGKGGASPDKCIVLSGNLPQEKVEELIDFYKVPRQNIMIKPPDADRFLEIVKNILEATTKENTVEEKLEALEEKIEEDVEEMKEVAGAATLCKETKLEMPVGKLLMMALSKLNTKHWLAVITILIALITSISTYSTYRGYKEHKEFKESLTNYCDGRFKNFRKGDEVSSRTYVENISILDHTEFEVRFYPDNFISILVSSLDDQFEPRLYWLAGPEYAKAKGIFDNKTFIQVFKETWFRSKKLN